MDVNGQRIPFGPGSHRGPMQVRVMAVDGKKKKEDMASEENKGAPDTSSVADTQPAPSDGQSGDAASDAKVVQGGQSAPTSAAGELSFSEFLNTNMWGKGCPQMATTDWKSWSGIGAKFTNFYKGLGCGQVKSIVGLLLLIFLIATIVCLSVTVSNARQDDGTVLAVTAASLANQSTFYTDPATTAGFVFKAIAAIQILQLGAWTPSVRQAGATGLTVVLDDAVKNGNGIYQPAGTLKKEVTLNIASNGVASANNNVLVANITPFNLVAGNFYIAYIKKTKDTPVTYVNLTGDPSNTQFAFDDTATVNPGAIQLISNGPFAASLGANFVYSKL